MQAARRYLAPLRLLKLWRAKRFPPRGPRSSMTALKIGFGGGGDLVIVQSEIVLIVLGTDKFFDGRVIGLAIAHFAAPGHVECAGVLHLERHLDGFFIAAHLPAFDDMKLSGMGGAVIIDEAEGMFEKPDRIDDERVAIFVMPDGFAEPVRFRIGAVPPVEIDAPDQLVAFPDHPDFLWGLQEEHF